MPACAGSSAGRQGSSASPRSRACSPRRQARVGRAPAPPPVDPADELRRKLDESRSEAAPAGVSPGPSTAVHRDEPAAPAETLEERRARVHAKAQEAIEAMEALAGAAGVSEQPPTPDVAGDARAPRGAGHALHDECGGSASPARSLPTDERAMQPAPGSYAWVSARSTPRPAAAAGAAAPARGLVPRRRSRRGGDRRPRRGRDRRRDGRRLGARRAHRVGGVAGRPATGAPRLRAASRAVPPGADPAWFSPPVEHTLLDTAGGDDVTEVTRLPPRLDDARGDGRAAARRLRRSRRRSVIRDRSLPRRVLFPTATFAIFFLIVLPLSWLTMPWPHRWRPFIIVASYVFYSWWDWRFVFLLAGCTLWNQVLAVRIWRTRRSQSQTEGAALSSRSPATSACSATSSTTTSSSPRRDNMAAIVGLDLPLSLKYDRPPGRHLVLHVHGDQLRRRRLPRRLRADDAREVRGLPLVLPAPRRRPDRPARRADPAARERRATRAGSTRAAPST